MSGTTMILTVFCKRRHTTHHYLKHWKLKLRKPNTFEEKSNLLAKPIYSLTFQRLQKRKFTNWRYELLDDLLSSPNLFSSDFVSFLSFELDKEIFVEREGYHYFKEILYRKNIEVYNGTRMKNANVFLTTFVSSGKLFGN